jgi:hypothetical protein
MQEPAKTQNADRSQSVTANAITHRKFIARPSVIIIITITKPEHDELKRKHGCPASDTIRHKTTSPSKKHISLSLAIRNLLHEQQLLLHYYWY